MHYSPQSSTDPSELLPIMTHDSLIARLLTAFCGLEVSYDSPNSLSSPEVFDHAPYYGCNGQCHGYHWAEQLARGRSC